MPGLHSERALQNEIIEELVQRGWARGENAKYDRKRALYSEDTIAWITSTEPTEYAKAQAMHNGDTEQKVLDRLVEAIDKQGTIHVLRNGFKHVNANFSMCAFVPNSRLNSAELERTKKVILRVVPELEYSENNDNRLDLAFFVNGIPVATAELKTENTQTIDDAVRQYCTTRPPKDPKTKKNEPLLTWKRGALVHFAMSSREVRMTTRLDGANTHFLPFNRGNHGGAGNPADQGVAYLWNEILDRCAWLDILAHFVCLERKKRIVNGRTERSETLLFPRYHQWDGVTRLVKAAMSEGAGHKYLIQHSAGSGKSNSIMWLAHRLAHLHNDTDKKVFDTVFVLTDRRVLDDQLADTVQQFDHATGVIARVDGERESKSEQLVKALAEGAPIVIVTLQTFPFVLDSIEDDAQWEGRSFAIIADEAHSSQSGTAANKVREVLGLSPDEGDIGVDDELTMRMQVHANPRNLSYFAFTATPKPRTLETFGRPGEDGKPEPFHVYTMRQAIEEGFIVDVLQNYTTFAMAYRVAMAGKDYQVPKGEAAKLIARMAKLHAYTISQKVAIIVEHFRETVAPLLAGHAKAMVVTDSREAAVRYKIQMDKYVAERGYANVNTLVAFSGDVPVDKDFPGTYNETRMNRLQGEDIARAFDTDAYQVLIVAEKYQTGFDQPLLCGMYVDKKLEHVAAVQTLSRLNRIYHGPFGDKDATYVLDFVNDAERIRDAFLPYYETATIDQITDPNKIHDFVHTIDDYGMPDIYTEPDIERFAKELHAQFHSEHPQQTKLNIIIDPAAERYMERLRISKRDSDARAIDEAGIFRKNLRSFVRAYRFLAQIYNFGDVAIAKREAFYDWLARAIREKQTGERTDISGVVLTHLRLDKTFNSAIKLAEGKVSPLRGATGIGTATPKAKEHGPLSEVIKLMNEFFGANIKEENQITIVAGVFNKGVADPTLATQARNNTREKFAIGDVNERIKKWMIETYVEAVDNNEANSQQLNDIKTLLSEDDKFGAFAQAMSNALYDTLKSNPAGPDTSAPI